MSGEGACTAGWMHNMGTGEGGEEGEGEGEERAVHLLQLHFTRRTHLQQLLQRLNLPAALYQQLHMPLVLLHWVRLGRQDRADCRCHRMLKHLRPGRGGGRWRSHWRARHEGSDRW